MAAGWLAYEIGPESHQDTDGDIATRLLSEALAVAQEVGDQESTALALHGLASLAINRGDFAEAARQTEAALALYLQLEATVGACRRLVGVAYATLGLMPARGDATAATPPLEEAERRQRALGAGWGYSYVLQSAADLGLMRGQRERALALYRESLEHAQDTESRVSYRALAEIAVVAAERGQLDAATQLFAAAAALRARRGVPMRWWRPTHDLALETLRATLTPEAFTAAWEAGERLSFAEAIALAGHSSPSDESRATPTPSAQPSLTRESARCCGCSSPVGLTVRSRPRLLWDAARRRPTSPAF